MSVMSVENPAAVATPIIKVDTALKSLRSSNFDTPSAVGELIDNALQANANTIRILILEDEEAAPPTKRRQKRAPAANVREVIVVDDGDGMTIDVLRESLVLGYSTRYDSRTGMGRFGVGSTLAGISQAKRIDVWSRTAARDQFLHSYIDLVEIEEGIQQTMPEPVATAVPPSLTDLVPTGSGTIVRWSTCDRIAQQSLNSQTTRDDLIDWIARTYREHLDNGIRIEVNGKRIELFDPLFLMTVPRFKSDPKAEVLVEKEFEWEVPSRPGTMSPIRYRFTLLPQEWRLKQGSGGTTFARDRRIDKNEGLSIRRAKREIFYGKLTGRFFPGWDEKDIDRWWGLEIDFQPELDECFQVRNVKKGAEPIPALRDRLRTELTPLVKAARSRITVDRKKDEIREQATQHVHKPAETIAAQVEQTSPKARSGRDVTEQERSQAIDSMVDQTTSSDGDPEEQQRVKGQRKQQVKELPFSILDLEWPGKEFIEIEHLGTNTIVKLNNRHPFFTKVYTKLLRAGSSTAGQGGDDPTEVAPMSPHDLQTLARVVQVGIDLLLVAYAKAESMDDDPDTKYGDLRTQWGMYLFNLVQQLEDHE